VSVRSETVSREAVETRLRRVMDPCSVVNGTDLDIVEMGLLEDVAVDGDHVTVSLHVTSPMCTMVSYFVKEVRREVGALDGVETVDLVADDGLTWAPSDMSDRARERRRARLLARDHSLDVARTGDADEGTSD